VSRGAAAPPSNRGAMAPPASNREAIPERLHESLMARLDRLGSAKLLAQRAAVLGRTFNDDILLAIADTDAASMRQDLERLLASGLVVHDSAASAATHNFKHALIRDVAYASLLRPARQEYHRRAAAALSRVPSAARQPDVIAMHYEEGGNDAEAIRHWQLAGKMASARSANREVIAHLERALALVERMPDSRERHESELPLHLAIAPAFMAINGWAAAQVERSCRRALDLSQAMGAMEAALQALWGLWSVHLVRGEILRALEASTQLLQASQQLQSAALAVMANHAAAFTRYYRGDLNEARRHAEAGIALLSLEQERFIVSQVQVSSTVIMEGILALVLWLQGRPDEGEQAIERGGRLAEELNHPPSAAFHLSLRCELRLWQRDAAKLLESSERMLQVAEAEGFELFVSTAHCYRGLARAMLGESTDGLAEAGQGWAAYSATGAGLNIVQEHCSRAEALTRAGRSDEAIALLDEAEQRSRALGEENCNAEVHRVRAEISAAGGRVQEAGDSARRAIEIARAQRAQALVLRAEESLARISGNGRSAIHDPGPELPATEQNGRA
jgi:tetratricopeptide (TPR) repeat protein